MSSPLLPRLARRLSFGSSSSPSASSSVLLPAPASCSSSSRRSLSSSATKSVRRPDEWSYPSLEGDNKPRRPFLNPDVSDTIPNEVARRAGLAPYRLPSGALDIYELPPKLRHPYDVLTHTITFTAYEPESLRAYSAMARHAALALLIPITGPRMFKPILQRWSSNKSPFVHSGSKEIFERRTYHVQMDVWDADDKAAEVLVKVLLASGRGEHVKVKVEKYSRGEFNLHSNSPTTAPLTHTTKRMTALVQEIADRFIREEKDRMDNMSSLDKQLAAAAEAEMANKMDEDERIAREAASIQSDQPTDVVVPTDAPITPTDAITKTSSFTPSSAASNDKPSSRSSVGPPVPEYAGQKIWEKHNKQVASSPRAIAQAKLAAISPSNTIQIFPTSPFLSSADEQNPALTSEQVPELIRPYIHVRSTFQVSTSPLHRAPTDFRRKPSADLAPVLKVRKHYVSPAQHALEETRKATIKSMPLPGEGAYYLVEFESGLEAQRVKEQLDDRVLADGTSLDVWYHEQISEEAEGPGGSLQDLEWTEVRGVGSGDAWREVNLQQERDAAFKTSEQREEAERAKRSHEKEVEARVKQMRHDEAAEEKRVKEEADAKTAAASALETVAEEGEEMAEQAKDVKDTVVETVEDKAGDVKESVLDTASAAKQAVQDTIENPPSASEVKESALATAEDTKAAVVDKAEEIKSAVQDKIADAPSVSEVQESAAETASEVKAAVEDKIAAASSALEMKAAAADTVESVKEKAQQVKESVVESAEDNAPEVPTTSEIKDAARSTVESAQETASDVAESVKDTAASVKATVEEKIGEVKPQTSSFLESVVEKAHEVQEAVAEKVEDIKETVGQAEEKVEKEVEATKEQAEVKKEELSEIVEEKELKVEEEVKEKKP